MTGDWFTETLYPEFQQRLRMSEVVYRLRTDYQDLVIFENPRFGRVLALDGVVQTTERDEFAYHEMVTHVPIIAHGAVRKVCIVGGGDGGALREVLKHPSIEKTTLVEIDRGVVDLCREFMPSLSDGAFDDSRTELVIADGIAFMTETDETFDLVIVDSTDPVGPAIPLFGTEFYRDCRDRLSESGILVTQSGVTFMQAREAQTTFSRIRSLFADTALYLTQVPTYCAGYMTLGWGCNSAAPRQTPARTVERRVAASGIETRYYNAAIHHAAFTLPNYIRTLTD